MQVDHVKDYYAQTLEGVMNWGLLKFGISTVIIVPTYILGVEIKFIIVLAGMSLLDAITGLARAKIKNEDITSERGRDTILKWVMYSAFVCGSWLLSLIFNDYAPIHSYSIVLLILHEAHSMTENIIKAEIIIPTPMREWIKGKLNIK